MKTPEQLEVGGVVGACVWTGSAGGHFERDRDDIREPDRLCRMQPHILRSALLIECSQQINARRGKDAPRVAD